MSENIFLEALNEVYGKNIQHGECTVTFTYHDGRVTYYTVSTTERHNAASSRKELLEEESCRKAT